MAKKKAKAPEHSVGDVYAVPLPGGRFGAARIMAIEDGKALVATTTYLGDVPAAIDDPALATIQTKSYFFWKDEPAVLWLTGPAPSAAILVGNLPVSDAEAASVPRNSYGWEWEEWPGDEALIRWRWLHDREALEREREEENAARLALAKRRKHKPRAMLPEDQFWELIGLLDKPLEATDESAFEPLVARLAAMNLRDIKKFAESLAWMLFRLDTRAHADAYAGGSDDGFLYARCAVVVSGKAFYESVRADPTFMPEDLDFEDLLSIIPSAWERKTGEDYDYVTGCSFETGSNPEGGWTS